MTLKYRDIDACPDFEFKGELIKSVVLPNDIGLTFIIKEKTINRDIFLLSIYVKGKRYRGIRVKEENINIFYIATILTRVVYDHA